MLCLVKHAQAHVARHPNTKTKHFTINLVKCDQIQQTFDWNWIVFVSQRQDLYSLPPPTARSPEMPFNFAQFKIGSIVICRHLKPTKTFIRLPDQFSSVNARSRRRVAYNKIYIRMMCFCE